MSEWISVYDKSKKPEIGKIYVCWLSKIKEPVCCKYEEDKHGPLWIELVPVTIDCLREDIITHWMELPKPPTE